ncbi:hypothetical protein SAMN05216257_102184 [Meinhardsimonia xiamenensis]|jgi:hypothetical protein|uniref:DUF1284 domain-containing protein n=1 Tax=Meinhardsimonia xiamenensis TaxID=990712 RepID=A0A1G9AL20_9RHOB|nr:DUF1284 domain-containing protein [Meinhardsimonia xiamenensis]PRX35338.1 hypothetical protein LV81_01935 [Meinhardsimonia xiamenensis]SDK27941.1 hypothetical protein SAMN05216257_102184 [Meinhardsimonia xiamenensis]
MTAPPKSPIRFRPHHFICALGYRGKGYSRAFTENMDALVVRRLRAAGGEAEVIEVVGLADDICAPCPRRRGRLCEVQPAIARLDDAHARALRLQVGDRLTWGEALERIRANVPPGGLKALCAGCQWLELGLCEAALRALHEQAGA